MGLRGLEEVARGRVGGQVCLSCLIQERGSVEKKIGLQKANCHCTSNPWIPLDMELSVLHLIEGLEGGEV